MQDFRLYVILDAGTLREYENILETGRKVILGGADILQLRAKGLSDREIIKIGQIIGPLARKHKVLLILNDQAQLVETCDADGVHLGQENLSAKDARRLLGDNKIIGLSTHSVEQAQQAQKQGVDYIGIGPIFPTATKPKAIPLGPQIITEVKRKIRIPFVAVGGINLNNLEQVLSSGARRIAVSRAIITAKDVFSATKKFKQRLKEA